MTTAADQQIALLIPSCDAYADVWPPLVEALQRFWPHRPFPTYLVTNHAAPRHEGIHILQVGNDVSWSDNLLAALRQVPQPYVLLNIDDLILSHEVNHAALMTVVEPFISSAGNYLRLNPTPPGTGHEAVGEVPPGEVYRSSTVFSLWRKEVLQAVLSRGESAWHFEILGSSRTDSYGSWYASNRPLLQYVNLVIKGKVDPRAAEVLRQSGISYSSTRPVLSRRAVLVRRLKELRSEILLLIPRRLQRSIRNVFHPV